MHIGLPHQVSERRCEVLCLTQLGAELSESIRRVELRRERPSSRATSFAGSN